MQYSDPGPQGRLTRRRRRAVAVLCSALRPLLLLALLSAGPGCATGVQGGRAAESIGPADLPIVLTQLAPEQDRPRRALAGGTVPAPFGEGARIVRVEPGAAMRVLTGDFASAADPDVSWDGRRMLFAAQRQAGERWNIYEMQLEDASVRQITRDCGNCRQPVYQGSFYSIVADRPWDQITFVSDRAGELNEFGPVPATSLYSCRMDGSDVQRLTYSGSSDFDPTLLPDGRLLYASWQRRTLERGFAGRVALFAVQTDGLDAALFAGDEGRRVKLMPCVTADRLVVFIDADRLDGGDGAGPLASVSLRRNLHSWRAVTAESDGLFHSPSPLPDGGILVSRRPLAGHATYGVYRLDPGSGRSELVFDDPRRDDLQARLPAPRPRCDGRSSVVSDQVNTGKLYCLDVHETDLPQSVWLARGQPSRLRVLEGVPRRGPPGALGLDDADVAAAVEGGFPAVGRNPLLPRRILGELNVAADGSFQVEVPADVPIELQLLDAEGHALRSCGWIWVRPRATRGCVGCHEDAERAPPNRFAEALQSPAVPLTLAPAQRRVVDFRRDVVPIVAARCASAACHGGDGAAPRLDGVPSTAGGPSAAPLDPARAYAGLLAGSWLDRAAPSPRGRHVHPGQARTSPLVWHVLGRNTSRPWDQAAVQGAFGPRATAAGLSDDEKRTLVEWIDLGAAWDGAGEQADPSAPPPPPPTGGVR